VGGRGAKSGGSRKPRRRLRRTFAAVEAHAAVVRATRNILVTSATVLAEPAVPPGGEGHQPHFLSRLERLTDPALELAKRLYYDHGLSQFVARFLLGLETSLTSHTKDPPNLEQVRLVVDLEAGASPSRLVMDAVGRVVTCLAPGMAVTSGLQITFDELNEAIELHGTWLLAMDRAKQIAETADITAALDRMERKGWAAPREDLLAISSLGPAGGALLLLRFNHCIEDYCVAIEEAVSSPAARTDAHLREWFRLSGALAAYLVLLGRYVTDPDPAMITALVRLPDPLLPLVLGASAACHFPERAETDLLLPDQGDEGDPAQYSLHRAEAVYFGILRARLLTLDPDSPRLADAQRRLAELRDDYARDIDECRQCGEVPDEELLLVRDIAIEALGDDPGWGDDVASDPTALPPPRLADLCLAGRRTSGAPIKRLARRLLWAVPRNPIALFWPRAQLADWRGPVGADEKVRSGTFRFPYVELGAPVQRATAVGRNDPCPCGSGKKHKRCCGAS
jgi:hypothetical protein